MPRLPSLSREGLSPEQAALFDSIASTRGAEVALDGPFGVWMHSPRLGEAAQRLGRHVRYHTVLPPRLSELAILVCAQHWRADFEWHVHAPAARAAGMSDEMLDAIRKGRAPQAAASDERVVYEFTRSLLKTSRVPQDRYDSAVEIIGRQGVIELTALVGYYTLVAMTLNAFEVEAPAPVAWAAD